MLDKVGLSLIFDIFVLLALVVGFPIAPEGLIAYAVGASTHISQQFVC